MAYPDSQAAREIAAEAYIFLYPLISMDLTRRVMTNGAPGATHGPANSFTHVRTYPTAEMRDVVRPNFDTLYSLGWLDLSAEPMILSVPDTHGRYYLLPMLDMWTDVFAAPGKRTSGTAAGDYAVVGPGWSGSLPSGMARIDAPTPHVWILGRTQTNGPPDYPAVNAVQDGYQLTPLSQWGGTRTPAPATTDSDIDMKTPPVAQIEAMSADQYFAYGARLMGTNPPHATDWSQVARMKQIGIEPGQTFGLEGMGPDLEEAIKQGASDGLAKMKASATSQGRAVNGWMITIDSIGVYGDFYLRRAVVALVGIGANQPEDAIYPLLTVDADGAPLTGDQRYRLHFDKDELPPVGAFWSVTMYDAEGFQVANPLDRFAIGDRDPLRFNADGSLDLYIQHGDPGDGFSSNWLPAPADGELGVTMRLYAPKPQVLDGLWAPPTIKPVGPARTL